MARESSSLASLVAAIMVTVAGLIPVIWLLSAEDPIPEGEVVVVETTTTTSPVATVVVEPVPVLEVDELNPAVVRVLQANGYAQMTDREFLDDELPDSVTRVLVDRGAVLTVVEEAPSNGEG